MHVMTFRFTAFTASAARGQTSDHITHLEDVDLYVDRLALMSGKGAVCA
jgi:hypothetical protein